MKLTFADHKWLWENHPLLQYEGKSQKIAGGLNIRAYFDAKSGQLKVGGGSANQSHPTFISDTFAIEIRLNSIDANGWPKVHEIGFRHTNIANNYRISLEDLHFYPDGSCCLTIGHPNERKIPISYYIDRLVVPFFYRLAYTDIYGIKATKEDLWEEYSHGRKGLYEWMIEQSAQLPQPPSNPQILNY